MDDPSSALEAEYCPPIDPALFSAIIYDHNLQDSASLEQARAILDTLKDTAIAEEATGFDPSGSSSIADIATDSRNENGSVSRDTDLTSVSNSLSTLDLTDDQAISTIDDLAGIEQLDCESKIQLLNDVFPSLSKFTVSHSLKKNGYKWALTFDDLLNQVYIYEKSESPKGDAIVAKGIDAFADDTSIPRNTKRKKKNQRHASGRSTPVSTVDMQEMTLPATNKWQVADSDIMFLAERTHLPTKLVSSIYNQHNASMQKTISAILEGYAQSNYSLLSEDPLIQVDAYQLGEEYSSISDRNRLALIGITRQSMSAAQDLAKALTTTRSPGISAPEKLVPRYAPLHISDDEETYLVPILSQAATMTPMDYGTASSKSSSLESARHAALTQARNAYRKSKSDRLMGGAAAYYSQVGRDMKQSSLLYNAAAADALVASQSAPDHIDLHGVTVDDAVRISQLKVRQWWDGLGENKFNGRIGAYNRSQGFRIVTGAGRHSRGGRGVLGPAVKKVLEREGWKIDVTSAEILVKGKNKP
ncbi:hypothetical protein AAFC00_006362 [Neodothiora populina]|uniref:Smr domain-containing protein n=1 Tax=Neodothiora populina TaxID=2781224 RepID=A0ABR3P6A0_9PEZI